jgi:hypothetical protein
MIIPASWVCTGCGRELPVLHRTHRVLVRAAVALRLSRALPHRLADNAELAPRKATLGRFIDRTLRDVEVAP